MTQTINKGSTLDFKIGVGKVNSGNIVVFVQIINKYQIFKSESQLIMIVYNSKYEAGVYDRKYVTIFRKITGYKVSI